MARESKTEYLTVSEIQEAKPGTSLCRHLHPQPLRDACVGARVSDAPCLPPQGSTQSCLHPSKQASLPGGVPPTQSVTEQLGGGGAGWSSLSWLHCLLWGEDDHIILCGPAVAHPPLPLHPPHLGAHQWACSSFSLPPCRLPCRMGSWIKFNYSGTLLIPRREGAGTVNPVSNEEMKAEKGGSDWPKVTQQVNGRASADWSYTGLLS